MHVTVSVALLHLPQNISNIIVSAQSVDDALLASVGTTCALTLYDPSGGPLGFNCVTSDNDNVVTDSPFSGYVVSVGYLIIALVTIPLSYIALDGNIIFQVVGESCAGGVRVLEPSTVRYSHVRAAVFQGWDS